MPVLDGEGQDFVLPRKLIPQHGFYLPRRTAFFWDHKCRLLEEAGLPTDLE
jgi:hypothetical protein